MSAPGARSPNEARSRDGGTRIVAHATCLGCGCACDDIEVVVAGDCIVEARRACPLGVAWFGDGIVPARALAGGHDVPLDEALEATARLLAEAANPLVYLAPDLSCEAQREAVALADLLRATLDSVTSSTILPSVLAAQERGRASATLGEVRNRGDVIVFWGVDPDRRYPRFTTRYAPEPAGMYVPEGRRSRRVVAVDVTDVGSDDLDSRGPADADQRVALPAAHEVAALTALRALVTGTAESIEPVSLPTGVAWETARALAPTLLDARYAVLVHDAEPVPGRDPARADAILALAQALNGPTRAALATLRAGGNRTGADAVMTSQTGFPMAVDFARGWPRYRPYDGSAAERLGRMEVDAVLVVGSAARAALDVGSALASTAWAVIGPRASESRLATEVAAIDSAVAGIHAGGTALRMDDVPLPLRPSLAGPPDAAALVRRVRERAARLLADLPTTGSLP